MNTKNEGRKAIMNTSNKSVSRRKSTNRGGMDKILRVVAPVSNRRNEYIDRKKDRENRKPLPVGAIICVLAFTVVIVFLMMTYAKADTVNSDIASLKNELTELQQQADKLSERVTYKNRNIVPDGYATLEDYASEELGMVAKNNLNQNPININDEIEPNGEVYRHNEERNKGFGVILSALGKPILYFFE